MPSKEQPGENDWQRIWDARLDALEPILGDSGDMVFHAPLPLFMGGNADVLRFQNYLPGFTYVTADLTNKEAGQPPNSFGNYELMICTQAEIPAAPNLISKLARYTLESILEPGETMDLATYFGDSTLRGLLFSHPGAGPAHFVLDEQPCSLLLCIGITKSEVDFKLSNGSDALLALLRSASVFPYTIPDRPSVA